MSRACNPFFEDVSYFHDVVTNPFLLPSLTSVNKIQEDTVGKPYPANNL